MTRNRSEATKTDELAGEEPVIEYNGLCGTCENAPTCIYVGNAEHPVMGCEEFTHHRAGVSKPSLPHLNLAAMPKDTEESRIQQAMGLCADCGNRETCIFVGSEGGVWQCEEYQ